MVQVHAPVLPPKAPTHQQRYILFCHPGYDDAHNVLFKLHAPDTDEENKQPGIFAQFAIDACAVVAGDTTGRGWLSLSRLGSDPIEPTSTLCEPKYYFHFDLDADNKLYPIVPNFRQWSYPHDCLPLHWQKLALNRDNFTSNVQLTPSNLTAALFMRGGSCRLSGSCEQLQVAHVVPQSELDWWMVNGMSRYNVGSASTIRDTANALLLRADLHMTFDEPRVAFVPKPNIDGNMRLVAHVLEYSPELEHLYHNRQLHPTDIGVDMLYARFAWSIFTLLDAFLECKIDRLLTLHISDRHLYDARGFVAADNCTLFSTAAMKKRSQRPKKRKPERETVTVTEPEEPADTPARISQQCSSTAQVENASPEPFSAKRARCDPPPLRSPSEDSSPILVQKATHASTGLSVPQLDRCLSPPLPSLTLAQAWLQSERQRSDPDGTWAKEQEWVQQVWDGKTLTSDEVARWFEASGVEMRDV